MSVVYVRRMLRTADGMSRAQRATASAGTRVGIALVRRDGVPVFWMISSAFKSDDQIYSCTPTWFPTPPDARALPRRDRPAVLLDGREEHRHRRARHGRDRARARVLRGGCAREVPVHRAEAVHRPRDRDPDASRRRADHSALRRARPLPPGQHALRPDPRLPDLRAPVLVWTLRGFILGIPKELEEAAMVDGSRGSARSSASCCRSSRRGWSRPSVFAFITSWNEYIFARTCSATARRRRSPSGCRTSTAAAGRRLGRADGRLDVHRDSGRDLLPHRPAPNRLRPDRRRRKGLRWMQD